MGSRVQKTRAARDVETTRKGTVLLLALLPLLGSAAPPLPPLPRSAARTSHLFLPKHCFPTRHAASPGAP